MTETTDQPRIHYAYFGRLPGERPSKGGKGGGPNHNGVITAAYRFTQRDRLEVAFAYCMPEDTFSKKKAHEKAEPRLILGRGFRRHKSTGRHVMARWGAHLGLDEKPLVAVCRAYNQIKMTCSVPRTFKDWELSPDMSTPHKEQSSPTLETA